MDVDSQSGGPSSKLVKESNLVNALRALLKSINPQKAEKLESDLTQMLELINQVRAAAATRNTLNAIYDGEKTLFERLSKFQESSPAATLEAILSDYVLQIFASTDSVEQTRLKAAETVNAIAPIARRSDRLKSILIERLAEAQVQERSTSVQQSLDRARKLL